MNLKLIFGKTQYVIILILLIQFQLFSREYPLPPDTSFVELRGSVKDKDTREAIVFASVYLAGTNIGTVTNTDGQFIIKVPMNHISGKIGVSCLGYKNIEIPIPDLEKVRNEIQLQLARYYIRELTIRKVDPIQLVRDARLKIPENYGNSPAMLTAFYRETIRQNRNYVAISEAVFDVYKAPYSRYIDNDRVKIYKGRKSQDVSKMDTILFRLQGGPYYLFMLDIVKNPDELISEENMNFYNYYYSGLETVEDREAYVVEFDQKAGISMSLYKGKIYIDMNTLAISGIDFQLSPNGLAFAPEAMIKKKPVGMKIDIPGANYIVKYRLIEGRWYLSYARTEARFRCKWNRKLFRSTYTTVSEMAITDIDPVNIIKYKARESTKPTDVFSEQVSDFEDPEFWGEYNIIRPEESIEAATQKLAKKLHRE
jgi:hypothetical protein